MGYGGGRNLYGYVGGNPLAYVDRDGRFALVALLPLMEAAAAAGTVYYAEKLIDGLMQPQQHSPPPYYNPPSNNDTSDNAQQDQDSQASAEGVNCPPETVHGNSHKSQRPTDVYYLINKESDAIDKIGITSDLDGGRYSQSYLDAENVRYVPHPQYSSRYPAVVDEKIRLTWYVMNHGSLPRLNQVTR
jgi:hypothetical protein